MLCSECECHVSFRERDRKTWKDETVFVCGRRQKKKEATLTINRTSVVSNSIAIQLMLTSKIPFNHHKPEITPATNTKSIIKLTSSLGKKKKKE
jgi:hypothetical protein